MTKTSLSKRVAKQLAEAFQRNGYVRWPSLDRRKAENRAYKKGYEVRLVASDREELLSMRELLRQAGFRPARPFAKSNQWRQPIYGRKAVGRFLVLIGELSEADLDEDLQLPLR